MNNRDFISNAERRRYEILQKNKKKPLINKDCLITLPCKVGTEVWSAAPFIDNIPRKGYITAFVIDEKGVYSFYVSFGSEPVSAEFLISNIGETIFFTLEEAKANLKEAEKEIERLENEE